MLKKLIRGRLDALAEDMNYDTSYLGAVLDADLSAFMQFCFDLNGLLMRLERQPLLQSAVWNHYVYWFQIIGKELRDRLGKALTSFLRWKPAAANKDAADAIQAYVREALTILDRLTSQEFAKPIDALLESTKAP